MLEQRHEIVHFSSNVPVKLFVHRLGSVARHWHHSLELLLVLDGQLDITIDNEESHLAPEDMILINANTIHSLSSENAVLLAVQIKTERFLFSDAERIRFDCNSAQSGNPEAFDALKRIIAVMVRFSESSGEADEYRYMAMANHLISVLFEYFQSRREPAAQESMHSERLKRILTYIGQHYADGLSLRQVADAEGLSASYFSSYFEKNMGMNYFAYYSSVRLEHASDELLTTKDSIESIALRNGYAEPHAFTRAFKKHYGVSPGLYRREQRGANGAPSETGVNYLSLEPGGYLRVLAKYLPQTPISQYEPYRSPQETGIELSETVSVQNPGRAFGESLFRFIGVGSAKELLEGDIQEMLRRVQREIGFTHVKFHGILSDEMMAVERRKGKLCFSFVLIDKLLDFLLSIGLTPLMQLSFMPAALAARPQNRIAQERYVISPPADIAEWRLLIDELLRHLMARYGRQTVESWPFTVWNEPEVAESLFGFNDDNAFFALYRETYHAVKAASADIRFGAPSIMMMVDRSLGWIESFLQRAINADCSPDFLLVHYYANDFQLGTETDVNKSGVSVLFREPDALLESTRRTRLMAERVGLGHLPMYMTEWNLTVSHRSYINDTCFIACYLARNMALCESLLDSFGYWSLSDQIGEHQLSPRLFHGGMGMFTQTGVPKPAFHVYRFFRKLGQTLIGSGDSYVVTTSQEGIQILCWNYEHYSALYASGEMFDMTFLDRYTPFLQQRALRLTLTLTDMADGAYQLREYYINREHGSAFDAWLASGAVEPASPEDTALLQAASSPGYHCRALSAAGGALTLSAMLKPFELRLIVITASQN